MNDRIKFLLEKAKLKLTDEEYSKFLVDYENFKNDLKILDNFDLLWVDELRQPFETNKNFLRKDIPEKVDNKIILENASKTKDNYVFLEEVKEDV